MREKGNGSRGWNEREKCLTPFYCLSNSYNGYLNWFKSDFVTAAFKNVFFLEKGVDLFSDMST